MKKHIKNMCVEKHSTQPADKTRIILCCSDNTDDPYPQNPWTTFLDAKIRPSSTKASRYNIPTPNHSR